MHYTVVYLLKRRLPTDPWPTENPVRWHAYTTTSYQGGETEDDIMTDAQLREMFDPGMEHYRALYDVEFLYVVRGKSHETRKHQCKSPYYRS